MHVQIDFDRGLAAQRHDLLLLQHSQQPRLQRERHVADFIEKQGPARGLQDLAAHSFLARAGERPGFVTEQLAFDQRFGNRRAVDRDERPFRAPADEMHRMRERFLAGTCWTLDEYRHAGVGNAIRTAHIAQHLRVFAGQVLQGERVL